MIKLKDIIFEYTMSVKPPRRLIWNSSLLLKKTAVSSTKFPQEIFQLASLSLLCKTKRCHISFTITSFVMIIFNNCQNVSCTTAIHKWLTIFSISVSEEFQH